MSYPNPLTPATILLVDDTIDNLRLLTKILEPQGYRVRKTTSGKLALQSVQIEAPDLILLDINMPEMDGYEVCQELKASVQTCKIPVMFVSAYDQVGDKVRAFELGGTDYITKPFQEQEILVRVRTQLLVYQQKRQLIAQNQRLEQEVLERQRVEAEVLHLNSNLERQVHLRTLELEQSLNFEATLKRISDKVRDSLDPHQILQVAIAELAQALEVQCCDAVLYSADRRTSTIYYQRLEAGQPSSEGQVISIDEIPEIYEQLHHQVCFAFCQIQPLPIRNHSATLACPIFDDQVEQKGLLGDLWLFKPTHSSFSDMEIHLVEQVANQCAIALRQARLYAAAQTQVQELERLNRLKDDFLSTISHELRTPVASMKLALQMLVVTLAAIPIASTDTYQQLTHYIQTLQNECDRELELLKDLLDLQHLNAGLNLENTPIDLSLWLPHVLEPFESRAQQQQQTLRLHLPSNLPLLPADLPSLTRIVTELLNNACKYTPTGEVITIEVSPSPGRIQLSVSNTGIEVSVEEIPRIFDKFYRIPNNDPWKYGGTGLGLALVKKLVEEMGGTIAVESAHNLTRFIVELPIVPNRNNSLP